jgi:hypothetical protein
MKKTNVYYKNQVIIPRMAYVIKKNRRYFFCNTFRLLFTYKEKRVMALYIIFPSQFSSARH